MKHIKQFLILGVMQILLELKWNLKKVLTFTTICIVQQNL